MTSTPELLARDSLPSSGAGKSASSFSPASATSSRRTHIPTMTFYDADRGDFDALSMAVQGADDLMKNVQLSTDVTSASGETDDGERKIPHSFPKQSPRRKQSNPHSHNPRQASGARSSWGLHDDDNELRDRSRSKSNNRKASMAEQEAQFVESEVHVAGESIEPVTLTESHPIPPASATHRIPRPRTKHCPPVMQDVALPRCVVPDRSPLPTSTTRDEPTAMTSDTESSTAAVSSSSHSRLSTTRTLVKRLSNGDTFPQVPLLDPTTVANQTGPATSASASKRNTPKTTESDVSLPHLCATMDDDSPLRRRAPQPPAVAPQPPHPPATAFPDVLDMSPTTPFTPHQRLSVGHDAIIGHWRSSWRNRNMATPQFSAGDAQGEEGSLSSPHVGGTTGGISQRRGLRFSVSEQPSMASDATFVDHGDSSLYASLRGQGSVSSATPGPGSLHVFHFGDSVGGRGTPLKRSDEQLVDGSFYRTWRAPSHGTASPLVQPCRTLRLASPSAPRPALHDASASGSPIATVPQLDSSDEDSDGDVGAASAMTARPHASARRTPATAVPSTGRGAVGRGTDGAVGPVTPPRARSETAREPRTAAVSSAPSTSADAAHPLPHRPDKVKRADASASINAHRTQVRARPHGSSRSNRKSAHELSQYEQAVKYARDRKCGLTVKELLAKGFAHASDDDEDEDDDDDDDCEDDETGADESDLQPK